MSADEHLRPAGRALVNDLRLAWTLIRGCGRREWWRVGLTAAGAGLATGLAQGAVVVASLRGHVHVAYGNGLLDRPGERGGIDFGLVVLLIPVLGFLGQCARVGAVRRDRRLAGLRLAGAGAGQVRRIAGFETGLACLAGMLPVTLAVVVAVLRLWTAPTALTWAGIAVVALAVPALGAAAGVLALRRVVASPLGWVRRVPVGRAPVLPVVVIVVPIGATALLGGNWPALTALLLGIGAGAVWLAGVCAGLAGRLLARRARTAAVLIAAERLRADPWAAARTHAAVLLVTVVGTGFAGVRHVFLTDLLTENLAAGPGFYTTGLDLTAVAIGVGALITLAGLAVGTAESVANRRRGLAAQVAAGVPYSVLRRALLLETALPLAGPVLLAGAGGLAVGAGYATLVHGTPTVPYGGLLVPVGIYAACLLAAAASLPLLRRAVRPGELRYA